MPDHARAREGRRCRARVDIEDGSDHHPSTPLSTIRWESAFDACAWALRRAILAGESPPGTRLPPERTPADAFGVNRVTVRSARARLDAERLVSIQQGSGYEVRDFERTAGPDLIS